jgi:hypothetical protein
MSRSNSTAEADARDGNTLPQKMMELSKTKPTEAATATSEYRDRKDEAILPFASEFGKDTDAGVNLLESSLSSRDARRAL